MSPVMLMLFSGIFHSTLARNRLRSFDITGREDSWTAARDECNKRNQSLVTIYDQQDITFVENLLCLSDCCQANPEFWGTNWWLGLHLSPHNVSTWSDGSPFTFNKSKVSVTNGEQRCEAIDKGVWKGFNCSDRKYFMCQRGSSYSLIKNEMNWCQAQDYCRKHFYSDLASIGNQTQNDQVIEQGQNKTFWIGLMHDQWKWEDKGCSTYREWDNSDSYNCTVVLNKKLYSQKCIIIGQILCSTGAVRIKVVEKNCTWEEAFDYCEAHHSRLLQIEDEQDQESVEQWLKHLTNGTFWIGLRQSRVFGFWIWADRPVEYDHWMNSSIPEMPMSENCGVIKTEDYRWRDENCWYLHPFLCEEDISYMRQLQSSANSSRFTLYS